MSNASIESTPYDTARLLFGTSVETWINEYDAKRIASYKLYEDIYWNKPETFKLLMRGTNENPIYIPAGRIICNTMNRYVCRGFGWAPDAALGSDKDKANLVLAFETLFRREKFRSRFNTNKLYGIIRGDSAWLISAELEKPEGSRISVEPIDPASVFPVENPEDPDDVWGVDIIEQIVNGDVLYVKRQRWLKTQCPDHPGYNETAVEFDGEISYQVDSFEMEGWEDPTAQKRYSQGEKVDPIIIEGITRLPVYTWKNFDEPENPWGSSELRGLETLFAGVNQGASDQDLALAIAGLGLYVTDAGAPVDENDQETTWGLGPAEVVEVGPNKKFERISGVTTVDPSLSHINFLLDSAYRTSGASDVAQGRVDVQMAESGIALQLRMGPILDEAAIKDQLIMDTMTQMFYDLKQWMDVYEGMSFGDATLLPTVGKKLPDNEDAWIETLFKGYNAIPAIFSGSFVRSELRRMGKEIPDDASMMDQIINEANVFTDATAVEGDPDAERLDQEAGDEEEV